MHVAPTAARQAKRSRTAARTVGGGVTAFGFAVLAGALTVSGPLGAQTGPLKSGLRGRVVIAPELLSAKTWPVDEEGQRRLTQGARVRRPTGQGPARVNTEPKPELLVVLEGARAPEKPAPRALRVEGMRFVPSQLLVARPGEVRIENTQQRAVTIISTGEVLATIEPGESAELALDDGDHALEIRELPFAHATVKVLPPSRFLPVTSAGEIEPIAIDSGEYQLAFYHGGRALRVQSLNIPDEKYLAVDAAVSANGVVTVSIKDGDLQVAIPPQPIKPPPPPRPAPKPEPAATEGAAGGPKSTAPAPGADSPVEDRGQE